MKEPTELMAFRLPQDLARSIRAQAVDGATITDVVVRMLRASPVRLGEFHVGAVQPPTKRASKKAQAAEARKAADPLAQILGRDDIDYMNPDELPSAGSVGMALDVVGTTGGKASIETWRINRKPLLKPSERKQK